MTFTLSLSKAQPTFVVVQLEFTYTTGLVSSDFLGLPSGIQFNAGETTKTFTVTANSSASSVGTVTVSIASVSSGAQAGTPSSVTLTTVAAGTAIPAAPTNLRVTPGNAKLDLVWTAPAGTVASYDVHYTASTSVLDHAAAGSDAATGWVAVTRIGTTASQTISSLTNDQAYRVRVRARNSSHPGP